MAEDQNIEYKESWNDEYLKWVCGFANAQGGKIYIGIDNNGDAVGAADSHKLIEDIPQKIKQQLGIMADVNLIDKCGVDVVEIVTHPYDVPISLRGRYYYRSGATKLEFTGTSLTDFLLKKSGKTWDSVVEPTADINDIDGETVKRFRKDAVRSGRLPDNDDHDHDDDESVRMCLEKLNLIEDAKIRRAALVAFGKEPRRFFPNLQVRIGRFGTSDEDLKFQEVVEGNVLYLLRSVTDLLNSKFLTKAIDFEGLQRVEKGEYPVTAIREMLLNALAHRDYRGAPIQIRVYDNKISMWNEGLLPEGLSLESLKRQHPSRPRNPLVAEVLFDCGFIDMWGVGTLKIIKACKDAELPNPEIVERDGGLQVTVFKHKYTEDSLKELGVSDRQIKAVLHVVNNGKITNARYQEMYEVSRNTASSDLNDLVKRGIFRQAGTKGAGSFYELA